MSYSTTVTKEDLKNVLNEVLPSPTLNPWALLDASGFTGNNTATKVTGTTTRSGGNASEYFDTSTPDQITIKKAGLYKVTCCFGLSATSNVSNVKRIACYANGNESATALSRTQSWENVMSFVTRTYSKDDVLTMYRRAEDGNSTYSQATILVEALHASSGNVRAEADYIVEQGTSGIWTYRKWNSGIQEAWAVSSDSFAMTSGISINQYYGAKSYSISTLGFIAIHNIQITGKGSGAYFASKVESFDTSTINLSARASNTNTTTLTHWFYVKGTWK